MSSKPSAVSSRASPLSIALRSAVLVALTAFTFRRELRDIVTAALRDAEWSHAWAVPVIAALILARRLDRFRAAPVRPSRLGVPLLVASIVLWILSTWQLRIGYARGACLVLAAVALVLALEGWQALRIAVPLLLLLALCLPLGAAEFERRTLRLQHATLRVTSFALSALPGVDARVTGTHLAYTRNGRDGTIGLGVPRNGAKLLVATLVVAVLVACGRPRAGWEVTAVAVAALPVVLFCNVLRILSQGLVTIYGNFGPADALPRALSHAASVLIAYLLFAGMLAVCNTLIEIAQPEPEGIDHD